MKLFNWKYLLLTALLLQAFCTGKSQDYPTIEKHIASIIREGHYDEAIKVLEENFDRYRKDTSKVEIFNWLADLYLLKKDWKKFIALYNGHLYSPGEDTTVLNAARFFKSYQERITVKPGNDWIKYKKSTGKTPKILMRINGKKWRFWVDTGAGLSVVSSKLAKKCHLKQYLPGKGRAISATGHAVGIRYGMIDSLNGAGLSVQNHACLVLDKKDLRFLKIIGIPLIKIDGIIGWNLLQELSVDIDFPSKKIRFNPSPAQPVRDNNFFWIGQPMTTAISNNIPLLFFLDTGASQSGLYETIYNVADTSQVDHKQIRMASAGGAYKVNTSVFPQFRLTAGGQTLVMEDVAVEPKMSEDKIFTQHGVLGVKEMKDYILHFCLKEGVFQLTLP